jgi:demethylmenaquinone methyltransferase/2-methoxy-6-polyprenyl-1,4-benzoquinol methylase
MTTPPPPTPPTPPHPVLDEYYRTADDRQSFVSELFDGAAEHYERVGRMFDWGTGNWFRRRALRRAGLYRGMRLLDVATGTGLLARAAKDVVGAAGRVIGVDPSTGMLREARKAPAGPLVFGRAETLPFRSDTFDMLSMGFALRHVPSLEVAFREYWRVLKPGGRMLLLEVSRPPSAVGRALLRIHLQRILPLMTRISTGSEPAQVLMKFYWDTIDRCVPPETILAVLRQGGFIHVERHVLFGFLSEYVAVKPTR